MTENYTCNWWGSANAAAVALAAASSTNYTPWLTVGTDDPMGGVGFQPLMGACGGTPVVITSAVPSPETCGGNNGSILVTFSGGTGPYLVSWTGGSAPGQAGPTYNITGLTAGAYGITVTDMFKMCIRDRRK